MAQLCELSLYCQYSARLIFVSLQKQMKAVLLDVDSKLPYALVNMVNALFKNIVLAEQLHS